MRTIGRAGVVEPSKGLHGTSEFPGPVRVYQLWYALRAYESLHAVDDLHLAFMFGRIAAGPIGVPVCHYHGYHFSVAGSFLIIEDEVVSSQELRELFGFLGLLLLNIIAALFATRNPLGLATVANLT